MSSLQPGCAVWTENVFQVCRALLVRNHPSALGLIRKLFGLFDDEEVNWDAAKAIGTSGSGGGQLLIKRFHATVRVRPEHVCYPRSVCLTAHDSAALRPEVLRRDRE